MLCGALHAAHRAKVWKGARDSNEPPILLFGSESVVARLVTEMATHWGLVAIDAVSLMGIVGEEASAEKTSVDPNTNSSEVYICVFPLVLPHSRVPHCFVPHPYAFRQSQ